MDVAALLQSGGAATPMTNVIRPGERERNDSVDRMGAETRLRIFSDCVLATVASMSGVASGHVFPRDTPGSQETASSDRSSQHRVDWRALSWGARRAALCVAVL